jgi:hypothetical protein
MKGVLKKIAIKYELLGFFIKKIMFCWFSLVNIFVPDKIFLKAQYYLRLKKKLNLKDPKLYNEKIQWLKLNYRNPQLNACVDKWAVRDYVSSKGYPDILVEAWGAWDSISEINTDELPNEFILKLTNGSGFNLICMNKSSFDFSKADRRFKSWVKTDFFSARREWAYKDVKNRIMCERLIKDQNGNLPSDYRFFCFQGEVKFVAVDLDSVENGVKTSAYYRHLFTPDWEEIDARIQYPRKEDASIPQPVNLDKMLEIAKELSQEFPAVRVDLYDDGDKVLFGELTFYHASGYQKIEPLEFEESMGAWFDIESVAAY